MLLPQQPGGLFRVGGDGRSGVEELDEALLGVVRGPAGVAVGGERRPRGADPRGQRFRLRGGGLADQQRGLAAAQVAEDQRYVEAVAGAEGAAEARAGQVSS